MTRHFLIRFVLLCTIFLVLGYQLDAWAVVELDEFKLKVSVNKIEEQFLIDASYQTVLTQCQAYRYLTDYEGAKKVPGVIESKVFRQAANRVIVERTAEESILFIKMHLHTQLEYLEHPYASTEFNQIKGDSKVFKGKWTLEPNAEGTLFKYQGKLVLDTNILPTFIMEYFIKNNVRERFAVMAKMAKDRKDLPIQACGSALMATQ